VTIMLEVRRKAFHIGAGILLIVLIRYQVLNLTSSLIVLGLGILASLISIHGRIPIIHWFLRTFDRPGAYPPGRGALMYMLSVCLLLFFFRGNECTIVCASIIILALGDSFSSLVGRGVKDSVHLTKTRHPLSTEKVLEGTFFGFLMAMLGAAVFVSLLEAALAAFVAMVIEGFDLRYGDMSLDDNLLIPLAAAITIVVVRLLA
jgi:dolichol kinase